MMLSVGSAPDPYFLAESEDARLHMERATSDLTPRSIMFSSSIRTLILIVGGQSNWTSLIPTYFGPAHSTAVSQFNVYDGAFYPITRRVLGCTTPGPPYGPGNISVRLADLLANHYHQVLLCNVAIGATSVGNWRNGGIYSQRGPVTMKRLAARGITPLTPGVTFAYLWGQGEGDNGVTSKEDYQAGLLEVIGAMRYAGFIGKFFVCKETYSLGVVSADVQAAQLAVVNGVDVFYGGDLDQFGSSYRQENLHFNDAGLTAVSNEVYAAMGGILY